MKFKYPDSRIVILCKAPIAGTAKTRLVPPLTHDEAVGFHVELATRSLGEPDVKSSILIGTDCINLDATYLEQAIESLTHAEACLGPAEDGGYGLIGLRRPESTVFEGMAWGTDSVCAETARAMNKCFENWQLLSLLWDVDRPEDLERYNNQTATGQNASCLPSTRELFQRAVASSSR